MGTCGGGSVRDGQACDITGVLDCPGGTCSAVSGPLALSGDEVGFSTPALGGMVYGLCPFAFQIGLPVELSNGNGSVSIDIAAEPMHACIPTTNTIKIDGAYLREPGSTKQSALEFYTGGAGASMSNARQPCPGIVMPLPDDYFGLPTSTGVGPIIGTTGLSLQ